MDILEQVVHALEKEELRHLKIFLTRTHSVKERKDIALLNDLRKQVKTGRAGKVTGKANHSNANAFYRLRNRLLEEIGKSLVLQNLGSSDFNLILNQLVLARLFKDKTLPDVALFFLRKAEKKAIDRDYRELLDIIYNEFIGISHETLLIDPEQYIGKRKKNWESLLRTREYDDILAVATFRIKKAQNFSVEKAGVVHLLKKVVQEYGTQSDLEEKPSFRIRMYRTVSRLLLQQNEFDALETYLEETYAAFEKAGWFGRENHEVRIEMLIYLANAHIKNNRLQDSLHRAEELKKALEEYGGALREKYLFNYYNILVNNYSRLNLDRAIEILEEVKDNPIISRHPFHIVYVYLNLAISYYGKKDYKKARTSLSMTMRQSGFKRLDKAFRLRIAILEGMILFDAAEWDYITYRMEQVQREFRHLLTHEELAREKAMVSLLKTGGGAKKITQRIRHAMDRVLGMDDKEAEERDMVNYNVWVQTSYKPSFFSR